MFIFARQQMKQELLDGAPPDTWAKCHASGLDTRADIVVVV
jgi:hypothetical protein